jgi:hypothetical protein
MAISLKSAANGLSGSIQLNGVDVLTLDGTSIVAASVNALNISQSYIAMNFQSYGSTNALTFGDRTTLTNNWTWYSVSNVAYLYSGIAGATGNKVSFDSSGNIVAVGNVTGTSDERLKTNWRDLGDGFVNRLAGVRCGVYDRTDQAMTQVGVSAQSLRDVMPDAVLEGADGMLSIAYGNAALACCIELAKRVVELEKQIKEMQ